MGNSDIYLPTTNDGYLGGQLLIATPQIQLSCFYRAVVYLTAHTAEGAMGFIINQPMQHISLAGVLEHFKLETEESIVDQPVYFGGPVDTARGFVLHSAEYRSEGTVNINSALSVTSSLDILREVAAGKGPARKLLALGHAGWGAGQLEQELEANSWLNVPATEELLFGDHPNDKWLLSNKLLGVDPYRISDVAGHA